MVTTKVCCVGVPDYSWDDCWLGYRVVPLPALLSPSSRPCWFNAPIVAIPCLPPWRRHARHAIDLGAGEFLR